MVRLAPPVLLALTARPDLRESPVRRVLPVPLAQPDPQVQMAQMVPTVPSGHPVPPVRLA